MSSGNLKPGPAAGDSDIRNAPIIETFVNRESELGTLSEPRPTTLQVNTLITPVQHRQSMPYEGVSARLADYPQSARILSGVHATPVHLTGQTSINIRENPSTQSSQSQQNNNMLFQKSSLHIRFTDEKQNRRREPKTNVLQHSCVSEDTNDCLQNQISSHYDFSNSARNCEDTLGRPMADRKAHTFCLSTSILALVLILLESCFLLACLNTKKNCATVASFVFRAALLSIIIILLEIIKSFLQRVKPSKMAGSHSANTVSVDIPVPRGGFKVRFRKCTAQPVLIISSSVDYIIDRRRCFIGKKALLTVIMTLFYFALIVILSDAVVWLSTKHSDLLKNVTLRNASNASSFIIKPKEMCLIPEILVGLICLVFHTSLVTLRLAICCIRSWAKGVRLLTAHHRSTVAHGSLFPLMEALLTSTDPGTVPHQHAENPSLNVSSEAAKS
ncbi:hypothetical protein TSMEX_004395 [Taenia solium]|eukprot:TsM_000416200 transcript=TsM_000416200 gene=TsM_000416200